MRLGRWICRYIFFTLLLAVAIFWSIYCQITINGLETKTESIEFIDLTLHSMTEANDIFLQIEHYNDLQMIGYVAVGVIVGIILLSVLWQVLEKKIKQKPKVKKPPVQKIIIQPAPISMQPAPKDPSATTPPVENLKSEPIAAEVSTSEKTSEELKNIEKTLELNKEENAKKVENLTEIDAKNEIKPVEPPQKEYFKVANSFEDGKKQEETKTVFCRFCGHPHASAPKFCHRCGKQQ